MQSVKTLTFMLFSILLALSFFNTKAQTNTVIIDRSILSSADDVEESEDGSYIYMTSSDVELVYDGSNNQGNQVIGMRFTDIEIPPDATITNAWVQFTTDASSTEPTSLVISGELSTNSLPFFALPFNVS